MVRKENVDMRIKRRYILLCSLAAVILFTKAAFCQGSDFILSTDILDFGHERTEKEIYITNMGENKLFWRVKVDAPWVKINRAEGEIESHQNIPADAPYYHSNMWPRKANTWYVISPESVGMDHEGNVYVLDSGSTPIKKFNQFEEFLFELGGNSAVMQNEPYRPNHIAFDSHDNFYITDTKTIKKFDKSGKFLGNITIKNDGVEEIIYPYDIAIDSKNNIYVTDIKSYCVYKIIPDGSYLKWGKRGMGEGDFENKSPKLGIVIDKNDYVYVADNHYCRIQKFDSEGNFIKKWGFSRSDYDSYIDDAQYSEIFAIDSQNMIYIGHEDSGFLGKFDTQGRAEPIEWENPRWLDKRVGIADAAIDKNGNIYLPSDRCIFKFDPKGKVIDELKSHNGEPGMFFWPVGMVVDKEGKVYVRDENKSMQVFAPDGKLIEKWNLGDYLTYPLGYSAMAADSEGNIYISQNYSKGATTLRLNPAGKIIFPVWNIGFNQLCIDSHDILYSYSMKFDRAGNRINEDESSFEEIISQKYGIDIYNFDLAIDSLDNTYIADYKEGIFKFDPARNLLFHIKYAPHTVQNYRYISDNGVQIAVDKKKVQPH